VNNARALATQSSGVQCDPTCVAEFEQMKIRSAYACARAAPALTRSARSPPSLLACCVCRYIVFKITDDKKNIVIDCKGEKGASFSEFTSKLPDGDCRYSVLDVEINTKSGATTNKLIFVAWSDDNASIKPKMLYASSKDALKKALSGINDEYQVRRSAPPRCRPRPPAVIRPLPPAPLPPCPPAPPDSPAVIHPTRPPPRVLQATDRGDLDEAEIKKKAGSV
jgi:cofilin